MKSTNAERDDGRASGATRDEARELAAGWPPRGRCAARESERTRLDGELAAASPPGELVSIAGHRCPVMRARTGREGQGSAWVGRGDLPLDLDRDRQLLRFRARSARLLGGDRAHHRAERRRSAATSLLRRCDGSGRAEHPPPRRAAALASVAFSTAARRASASTALGSSMPNVSEPMRMSSPTALAAASITAPARDRSRSTTTTSFDAS